MADVILHEYCEEAKEFIRSDSYDQAIAICRHILEHFPKHLISYRLLAEASLEKGDYVEAANLFKRVLSVDPEDVIAYVGLGIIYDEQGALDEALWQLERAFELTPGNAEIRGELQRLYGDRNGTTPPRLKLTPAALGRLYLKEELYQRAIDEFRGVLEEEPGRVDIQVALAEALWWNDQRREAAEVCEEILEEYPNCLKADLILGAILSISGREEEGQSLLHTAQAVDPENIVAQELLRDQSPLPAEPVYVRRLEKTELEEQVKELSPEMPALETEPEAVPPAMEEELEEEMPDWLRKLREGERHPPTEKEEVFAAAEAEEIPSWLRELEQEMPEDLEDALAYGEGRPPTVEEEMPSWLRELEGISEAPRGKEEEEAPPQDADVEERLAASKEPVRGEMEPEFPMIAPLEEEPSEEGAPAAEEVPDWLRELRGKTLEEEEAPAAEAEAEEIMAPPETVVEEKAAERKAPEWEEMGVESPAMADLEQESPTAADEEVEISEETMARLRETMPDESASFDEIMAWMERSKSIIDAEEAPPVLPETVEEAAPPPEGAEALAEEAAIPPEEEEIPPWLRELRAETMEEEEAVPLEETEASVEELVAPPEVEMPSWLRDLEAEAMGEEEAVPSVEIEAPVEEVVAPPEEELPSWLRDLRAEAMEEEEAVPSKEIEAPAEEIVAPTEVEIPSWLQDLRAEAIEDEEAPPLEEVEVRAEEMVAPPEAEISSWLRDLRAEAIEEGEAPPLEEVEVPAEEMVAPPEAEIPSWLRDLRAEAVEEEETVPFEEEVEPVLAEEDIRPSFVEEPPLIEIVPVEEEEIGEATPTVEEMKQKEVAEVSRSVEDYLAHLASNPQDHEARLALARAYLQEGDLNQAISHYGEIVSSGSLLDEVIDDLEATADDAPAHLATHELLADSYMKDGRLQKALDKYRWLRVKLAG